MVSRRNFFKVVVAASVAAAALGGGSLYFLGQGSGKVASYKWKVVYLGGLDLPLLVGIANGYFSEQGIDTIELVVAARSAVGAALLSRDTDFIGYATIPTAQTIIAGSPLKSILGLYEQGIIGLLVRSELRDQVKTVADLKGRTVGVAGFGDLSHASASFYLKKAGLDPQKDVALVQVGGDPNVAYVALKSGRIDALAFSLTFSARALDEGVAYALVPIWEPQEQTKWFGGKVLQSNLVTREDVIRDKPEVVQRMVNAYKKNLAYIKTHTGEQIVDLILKDSRTAPSVKGFGSRELLVKITDLWKVGYGDGSLSKSAYEKEVRLAFEAEFLKRLVPYEELVDDRFAGGSP